MIVQSSSLLSMIRPAYGGIFPHVKKLNIGIIIKCHFFPTHGIANDFWGPEDSNFNFIIYGNPLEKWI